MSQIKSPYTYDAKTGLVSRDGMPGFYLRVAPEGYLPPEALDAMVAAILLPALDVVGFGGRDGIELLQIAQGAFHEDFAARGKREGKVMVTAQELKREKDKPAMPEAVTLDAFLRELETMAGLDKSKAN